MSAHCSPISTSESIFSLVSRPTQCASLMQTKRRMAHLQASIQMSAQANAAKVAAAGAALLVATPAFAGDADAGEKIFNANCAACHAGGQNSVVPDHTLEKAAIEKVSVWECQDLGNVRPLSLHQPSAHMRISSPIRLRVHSWTRRVSGLGCGRETARKA